ncbi:hypothetical protein K7432_009923 [Basidiobolus ranarum]|uniref:Fe2OG dioxygenase domain-containing protein n=1 Tax=Basidiobolus ranarum TaxID=34480 RepID=A0ABR2WPJ1_9FUNG
MFTTEKRKPNDTLLETKSTEKETHSSKKSKVVSSKYFPQNGTDLVSQVVKENTSTDAEQITSEKEKKLEVSPKSIPLNEDVVRKIKKPGDLDLIYFQKLLPTQVATSLFQWCLSELPWYRVQYCVGDRQVSTPRWTTIFGKDFTSHLPTDKVYRRRPRPIPNLLIDLVKLMETYIDTVNNSSNILVQKNSSTSSSHDIRAMFSKIASKKKETTPPQAHLSSLEPNSTPTLDSKVGTPNRAVFNFVLLNYYETGNDSITYHSDDESFLGVNPTIASLSLGGSRDFLMKHKVNSDLKEKFTLVNGDCLVMQGGTQSNWLHTIPKRKSEVHPRVNITLRKAINVEGTNNYYKFNVGDGPTYRYRDGKMTPEVELH